MNNKFFYIAIIFYTFSINNTLSASWYSGMVSFARYVVGYEDDKAAREQAKVNNDLLAIVPKHTAVIEKCAGQIEKLGDTHKAIGSNISGQLCEIADTQKETNVVLGGGLEVLKGIRQGIYLVGSAWAAKEVVTTGYNAVTGARRWLLPTAAEVAQDAVEEKEIFNELERVKARTEYTKCILGNREAATAANGVPEICKPSHSLYLALSKKKQG